ncbi:hypothetical protein BRC94_12920 [Halobacteriales archaeon QS_5_70_17]|jgi:hypothetical protein|nr:MAG: hypothetical protein BRC94_12920 [Halobacteriales archaeon QS_5_70_17]
MTDSDLADELDVEDIETGGGTFKNALVAVAVFAVAIVVLKAKRGSSGSGESEEEDTLDEDADLEADLEEDESIDTISTGARSEDVADETGPADIETADSDDETDESESEDSEDSGIGVETSGDRSLTSDRFEELDVVDYLAIFAAALQAARDEYRIRTE